MRMIATQAIPTCRAAKQVMLQVHKMRILSRERTKSRVASSSTYMNATGKS